MNGFSYTPYIKIIPFFFFTRYDSHIIKSLAHLITITFTL